MKFFCDRCNAKYSISDEKVRGKVVKVRCKRCDNVITVSEEKNQAHGSTPDSETSGAGGRSTGGEWYYSVEGQTFGPLEKNRLIEKYKSGELSANSYVWKDSFSEWKPATDVEPFSTLLDEQAEQAGLSRPKRNTMDAGDSIEAVETSDEGSRGLSDRLGPSSSGSGGSGGRRGSNAGGSRSSSSSLPSVPDRDGDSDDRSSERSPGSAGGGRTSRGSTDRGGERSRSAGSRSSGDLGRERSSPEERSSGRNRSRRDRGRDREGSSSDDRRERLERLRGKLKSNFDPDSEAESEGDDEPSSSLGRGESTVPGRDPESGSPTRSTGGDQSGGRVGAAASSSAAAVDASAAERQRSRDESPASSSGPQPVGEEVGEAIAEMKDSGTGEETVDIDRSELEKFEDLESATRKVDVQGLQEGPEVEPEEDPAADEVEELDLDELDPVEVAESESGAPDEEDDFSLPPAGSSRLEEEDPRDSGGMEAPAPGLPGPEDAEETHPNLFDEQEEGDDRAAFPTAPKLGESDEESSESEGMTQSLLMQLDQIEDEGSTVRWAGAAGAVVLLAVGGVVGYIALAGPDEKDRKAKKEEPNPEQVAMREDDEAVQKTYSEDEIMALSPQTVEEGEGSEDSEGTNSGGSATSSGSGSEGEGILEGRSLTESEGASMKEAVKAMEESEKRSGDENSGDLREMEGSGRLAEAGGSEDSESESGSDSRGFEAMQAVEGGSPGVENPTEAARDRGGSGRGMALSKEQIRQGIKGVRESVATCRRRHARKGTPMDAGKIYLTLTIEPSGGVSGYSISPAKLQGVVFERCLASHKGRWQFGPFDGSAQKLKAPFIMQ